MNRKGVTKYRSKSTSIILMMHASKLENIAVRLILMMSLPWIHSHEILTKNEPMYSNITTRRERRTSPREYLHDSQNMTYWRRISEEEYFRSPLLHPAANPPRIKRQVDVDPSPHRSKRQVEVRPNTTQQLHYAPVGSNDSNTLYLAAMIPVHM